MSISLGLVVLVVVVVVVEAVGSGSGSGSGAFVGSGSLEAAFGFGFGSLEAFVAAFVAFVACAVAVAAKTAVAAQASNSLKMVDQEPKWVVAFVAAAAVLVALVEPDSHDASLPLKWKPNYSLVWYSIEYKCYKCM
jgi:hypothetical protein